MMKRYAMILLNRVIGVVEAETLPSWPPDPQGTPVTAIECDSNVELGMVYDEETKTFSEYIPPDYVPSQLDRIEENSTTVNNNSLILMEAMAEQYEQGLTNRLNDMEVQATIYEAVLELNKGGAAV